VALLPDLRQLSSAALLRTLNHLLAGQPWLRERLVPHAGRSCRIDVFPVTLLLQVAQDGALLLPPGDAVAEAEVRLSPVALARLLAGDEGARTEVHLSGDPGLAGALAGTVQALRWDAEEDLSRVVGDIAARRMVQGARDLATWQAGMIQGVAAGISEYFVEERALLARRGDVVRWSQEVDALRDAVERLEKRIEQAAQRVPRD
jgi:ubiquinone biosynthesis protein UbiJ